MSANDPRRTRSSYPSPADRRARQKKEEDPDWVPRPLNSFMIFRVEYSRRHAQNNKEGDNPVPEKNLSRQASEAWRKLSDAEKRAYKLRADQMKIEHAKQNPGYRYRP
ncbi:HMG-box, partial [Panus rudis PR-1116 ss-1]